MACDWRKLHFNDGRAAILGQNTRCYGQRTWGASAARERKRRGQYVVQPQLSSPVIRFELPVRFVTRVFSNNADTLVLEGREYAPADPRSNPSIPVRFTLRVNEKGDWKLIDNVRLTPNGKVSPAA